MAQQKYNILNKLDSGGMAEVWKGKATSMRGFEKLVAIKRVLSELAKKESFITMFLDEARLSLHLNHANVVQTFDVGSSDDAYFIVMEWVDGINLKGVLEGLALSGFRIPIEQAIFISIEICKGLYHAHRKATPDGEPLHIVHRDVSPPNVLISREGEVKLVDFGLAKAATQAFSTDQGMIKGKFSYLSPEAAWGKPVDERADIFAVGAILWEMLAGRKLFEGKSNKETVLMVREAHIPSLDPYNPYVDERLMAIIYKALTRDPEERFATAKDLAQALSKYLCDQKLFVTSYDIAALIERTLAEKAIDNTINPSMMDDIGVLEEQLVQFTSLEDLQRMQFRTVAEEDIHAHRPALPNAEDPRIWAAELGIDEEYSLPPIHGGGRPTPATTGLRLQPIQTEQHVSATTESNFQSPRLGVVVTPQPMGITASQEPETPSIDPYLQTGGARVQTQSIPKQTSTARPWFFYLIGAILLVALGVSLPIILSKLGVFSTSNTENPSVQREQPASIPPTTPSPLEQDSEHKEGGSLNFDDSAIEIE